MRVLVDAMGGDNAPEEIVKGCIEALHKRDNFDIVLVGDEKQINKALTFKAYDRDRITIKHASEVITNNDSPTRALRGKPDSSLAVAFKMLKNKEGDVLVSAGSSGALLVGSVMVLGKMPGVERPALGSVIPTATGCMLLTDCGLNTVCKESYYYQFAQLGAAYMKAVFGNDNPKVGVINMGTEDEKGPDVVKAANGMLKESDLNYIGFVESKELLDGVVDVAVTDGFTGNIILKLIEGASGFFFKGLKDVIKKDARSTIGAALLRKGLTDFKRRLDVDVNGGAPILGVDGLVIKSHGSSSARTIRYAILKACNLAESNFMEDIKLALNGSGSEGST